MRNPWFDLLRFILTLLVVNVHIRIISGARPDFLEPLTWYTVPVFVIMAFFFTGKANLAQRLRRLFLPFIFWSAAGFLIHPGLLNMGNIFFQLFTGHVVNTPLYYLALLAWFTLIHYLIRHSGFNSAARTTIYSLLVLTALFLEYSGINFSFFQPQVSVIEKSYGRFVELVKFVPIGLLAAYLVRESGKGMVMLTNSAILMMVALISSLIPQSADFHYSGLTILFGSASIFFLTVYLSDFGFPAALARQVHFLGRYSFGVYLSHYLLIEIVLRSLPGLRQSVNASRLPFLALFVLLAYLICYTIDRGTSGKLSFLVR